MTQIKAKSNRKRYRRPDTYGAAGALVGLDSSSAYRVIHGDRETTKPKRRELITWARNQAAKGSEAPAVIAALKNLAA